MRLKLISWVCSHELLKLSVRDSARGVHGYNDDWFMSYTVCNTVYVQIFEARHFCTLLFPNVLWIKSFEYTHVWYSKILCVYFSQIARNLRKLRKLCTLKMWMYMYMIVQAWWSRCVLSNPLVQGTYSWWQDWKLVWTKSDYTQKNHT